MAFGVTHLQVSSVADGTDPNQIQPSDWNAGHVLTGFSKIAGIDAVGSALGLITQTAVDTFAARSLVAGTGITITNPAGTAGNITIAVTAGVSQPVDATLTALAALDATAGLLVQTGADTFVKRSLAAGSVAIQIANPAGTAANPSIDVSAALTAINTLVAAASVGFIAMTATNAVAARSLTAGANITIVNADGVAGNPSIAVTAGVFQPLDASLTGLAAIPATAGLLVETSADVFTTRVLAVAGPEMSVANPAGTAGNPTFDVSAALAAVHAVVAAASVGFVVMTAANVLTARTIAVTAPLTITNGDGVAGNPTIALDVNGAALTGKYAQLAAANIFTASQTINQVAASPSFFFRRNSSTAVGDSVQIIYGYGQDSTAADTQYGYLQMRATNVTNTTEAADWRVVLLNAGALVTGLVLSGAGALTIAGTISEAGTLLSSKYQAADAMLTSMAGVAVGVVCCTAAGATAVGRTLAAGANISITNPAGTAGNPTIAVTGLTIGTNVQAFDAMLSSLAGVAVGMVACSVAGATAVARTITAGANITVTNGNGVSGNPTIAVSGLGTAAFQNTGTGGHTIPFLDGGHVWTGPGSAMQTSTNAAVYMSMRRTDGTQVGSIVMNGGSTDWNTSSDARLKDVIGEIDNSGEIIDALRPVSFRWKPETNMTPDVPEINYGFLAQENYEVHSSLAHPGVGEPGDSNFQPWGVDESSPMPWVIAELKALRKRVAQLEGGAP